MTSTVPVAGRYLVEGAEDFEASIADAPADSREVLQQLCLWAEALDQEHLVRLSTCHGRAVSLLPRLRDDEAGLVTIWNDRGAAPLALWRSVFERRAPEMVEPIEAELGMTLGVGKSTRNISPEVLELLIEAHRQAVSGAPHESP